MVVCPLEGNYQGAPGICFLIKRIWKGHFSHHAGMGLSSQKWPDALGQMLEGRVTREEG